jgi:hypothetical protein
MTRHSAGRPVSIGGGCSTWHRAEDLSGMAAFCGQVGLDDRFHPRGPGPVTLEPTCIQLCLPGWAVQVDLHLTEVRRKRATKDEGALDSRCVRWKRSVFEELVAESHFNRHQ